jgi:hypothetical protein
MKNNNKYTFLEWVFDDVGFSKFILLIYLFFLLISLAVLAGVYFYTKS